MFDLSHFNHIEEHVYVLNREDDRGNTSSCMAITGGFSDAVLEAYAGKIDCLISMPVSLVSVNGSTSVAEQSTHMNVEKAVVLQQFYERKSILLKQGCFCVEFLPEENGDNYQYLFQVKEMARKSGLEYYASVPWKKGDFVANTGRKSKNTENIVFFSKGRARDLRPDAKKDKQYENSRSIVEFKEFIPGSTTVHYSDMGGMGTSSETKVAPVDVNIRISIAKEDVERARTLLDTAWEDTAALSFDESPLDKDFGGDYTLEQLFDMPAQEYMLKYLESCNLQFVDLSPGPKNIFNSQTQVIVNPTNLIGPMGAGLAKEFRDKYPGLEEAYRESCRQRQFSSGVSKDGFKSLSGGGHEILMSESRAMFEGNLFMTGHNSKGPAILCFPTKRHWKDPSDLALIEAGLKTFIQNYKHCNIKSITFPKLGCGLGGLDWEKEVKPLMQKYLGNLPDLDVQICGDTLRQDKKEYFMSGAAGMLPTVFDVSAPSKGQKIHQAEKPVMLLEQILKFVTKENELVLDQFAGSGALGEAALNSGRNSILIEKDVETFNKLRERIVALGNVDVQTQEQKEAVNIAIDALEAAHDGPEHMEAFAKHQNEHGMTLADAFHALADIPIPQTESALVDALNAASEAIETADLQSEISLEQEKSAVKILECSSRGDKRFSALYAQVEIKGKTKSIEEWYQDAKRTADGKRAGKGKPFDHIIDPYTGDKLPSKDAIDLYRGLWITYLNNHPDLVEYASQFDEFTDVFSSERQELSLEELEAGLRPDTTLSPADIVGVFAKGDKDYYVAAVKSGHWYKNMQSRLASRSKRPALSSQIQAAEEKSAVAAEQTSLFQGKNNQGHGHWGI